VAPSATDAAWQDRAGRAWFELSAETDRQLGALGKLALDRLELQPGQRVIDVGCGAGQTLLQLADAVGPSGHVLGVDLSEVLLAAARARVDAAGAEQVAIACANAAEYAFEPHGAGAIFSRFGVMFFEHPRAAFAHLRAALTPGGRLAFVCWTALERNPWAVVPLAAVRAALPDAPLAPLLAPGAPGPFALSDPAYVDALLQSAGWRNVRVEPVETQIQIGGDGSVDSAAHYFSKIGPAARQLAESDPSLRPEGEAAIARALAPYASARGIWMDAAVLAVTARA
jgi:SAM-dependent methyltransferase